MKLCPQCRQQNQDDSRFCYQCGANLSESGGPAIVSSTELAYVDDDLWREFIGPHADRYLERFKKFGSEQAPKFALTWNWSAFLLFANCFLWFLYRKMYLYALVYAIGPAISVYLTGDITVGIVWSIMAGATGNYVYYWHCREQIGEIKQKTGGDHARRASAVKEAGGVQFYVIWVGVAFYLVLFMMMANIAQEELSDENRVPAKPAKPAASTVM
jgi:hypothetical protein